MIDSLEKRYNSDIGKELVRAKEIIDKFVFSCSHTLRGPLKSILGLIDLARQSMLTGTDDPDVYLNMIVGSVSKMEGLLYEMEQFLENAKQDLKCEPVDLQKILSQISQGLHEEIMTHRINLSVDIDQSAPFYADAQRLHIVLFHLISNAITFHDEKKESRFLHIVARICSSSCSVQVIDNGIGIEPEFHTRIFDIFFRASEKSNGCGVGLHIVREVLKKMGGSVSVNSVKGQGSNFFVWLPNQASLQQ